MAAFSFWPLKLLTATDSPRSQRTTQDSHLQKLNKQAYMFQGRYRCFAP
jgi:hypothetical protein